MTYVGSSISAVLISIFRSSDSYFSEFRFFVFGTPFFSMQPVPNWSVAGIAVSRVRRVGFATKKENTSEDGGRALLKGCYNGPRGRLWIF